MLVKLLTVFVFGKRRQGPGLASLPINLPQSWAELLEGLLQKSPSFLKIAVTWCLILSVRFSLPSTMITVSCFEGNSF